MLRMRMRSGDPSAVIGDAGLDGSCATCVEAVDLFVRLYGAQAGNLALTTMAVGGIYVGGGIVTKLLPKFVGRGFLDAFLAKDPHRALMQRMPVWVLLNPKTSQLGAAHAAEGGANINSPREYIELQDGETGTLNNLATGTDYSVACVAVSPTNISHPAVRNQTTL